MSVGEERKESSESQIESKKKLISCLLDRFGWQHCVREGAAKRESSLSETPDRVCSRRRLWWCKVCRAEEEVESAK